VVELAQAMGIIQDLLYRLRKSESGTKGKVIIGTTKAFSRESLMTFPILSKRRAGRSEREVTCVLT